MTTPTIGHNRPPSTGNWIAVSRDLRDHYYVGFGYQATTRFDRKNRRCFNRAEAWLDMLMHAQFEGKRMDVVGATVWIDIGQFLGSRRYLAERWNWSEQSVRTFLQRLEEEGMIVLSKPNQETNRVIRNAINHEKRGREKGLPNIVTICNYTRYQYLGDQIAAYVEDVKSTTNVTTKETNPPTNEQPTSNQPPTNEQPESNNVTTKQLNKDRDDSRASARTRETDPDPFELNHWRKSDKVQRAPDGTLTLANGKRAEWLKQFEDDADLDLSLKRIADKIQPNSIKTIEVQVEAQLAAIIQQRRDQDRRYQRAADNNSKQRPTPRGGADKGMSIDERLRLERERKSQEQNR